MTLTEFLLARIAEDEEMARAADGARWLHQDKLVTFEALGPDHEWVDVSAPLSVDTRANGWHITNWSPTRVLAECEAKRRLIEAAWDDHCQIEEEWGRSGSDRAALDATGDVPKVLEHLASVYADHPDYRPEWKQ